MCVWWQVGIISNIHFVLDRNTFIYKTGKNAKPYDQKVIVDAPIIKRRFSVTSNFNGSNNLASLEFILFRIMHYEIKDE